MVTFTVSPNFHSGQSFAGQLFTDTVTGFVPVESVPPKYGNVFIFKLRNHSTQVLDYDFRTLGTQSYDAPPVGTVAAGQTANVAFNPTNQTYEFGNVPVLGIGGHTAHLWFWSTMKGLERAQCINILKDDGFTITKDENYQNDAACATFSLGIGGGGGALATNNICIDIY